MGALTQDVAYKLEILDDGAVNLLRRRVIFEDAERVAENLHRRVLEPGDDVSALPARVQAICNFIWTPSVVSAYRQAKSAAIVGLPAVP